MDDSWKADGGISCVKLTFFDYVLSTADSFTRCYGERWRRLSKCLQHLVGRVVSKPVGKYVAHTDLVGGTRHLDDGLSRRHDRHGDDERLVSLRASIKVVSLPKSTVLTVTPPSEDPALTPTTTAITDKLQGLNARDLRMRCLITNHDTGICTIVTLTRIRGLCGVIHLVFWPSLLKQLSQDSDDLFHPNC